MQLPHMTLPQQSTFLSNAIGFSVFSSYCNRTSESLVAHVQQASSERCGFLLSDSIRVDWIFAMMLRVKCIKLRVYGGNV